MNDVEQEVRNTRNRETINNISVNGPRLEPRQPRINDQNDFAGANFKNIKLEAPTFDGQLDPQIFLIGFLTSTITLIGMTCPMKEGFDLSR